MNALIAMTVLWQNQPGVEAPAEEVAAWYESKAELHEMLAAQGGADAKQEEGYAVAAHEHALRLLQEERDLAGMGS